MILFHFQVRRDQVDEGRQQITERPHQRGNREPPRSAAAAAVDATATVAAAADGACLRLRPESQLFSTRWVGKKPFTVNFTCM